MTRRETLQIVVALGVAALFAALLPIRMDDAAARRSSDECLTLSAHPPGHEAAGAIAGYLRCLELEPRDPVLLADAGLLYEESGDVARAEEMYRRALAIDPAYADVHTRLGRLLLRQGNTAAARAEAERAKELTLNASGASLLREAAR
jgi:tetratricopeptide (TPR) repeat protein